MSLYNDPQYFTGYRANLKATADQGDNSWTVVSEQLAFLTDIQNWTRLGHLRANQSSEPVSDDTQLSASKIANGFKGFMFEDESQMVFQFLMAVGKPQGEDFVFTPAELSSYLTNFKKEMTRTQQSDNFLKSVSLNGTITAEDVEKIGRTYKVEFSPQDIANLMTLATSKPGSKVMSEEQFKQFIEQAIIGDVKD